MRLNKLSDNPGARSARKRVGRGIGSGVGKTSGKGHKGQKSRSGVAVSAFEGGQMPIYRRLPKRGFKNHGRLTFAEVNIGDLQAALDSGKIGADIVVDTTALINSGLVRRALDGVRLLGRGELTSVVTIEVAGASKSAVRAVTGAGGKVLVAGQELTVEG